MTFRNAAINTPTTARTENGMKAQISTLRNTVDLFYKFGASRGRDITQEFEKAYREDRDIALRLMQWGRDVRGGAGERGLFRQLLLFLEKNYTTELIETRILDNVPVIGRWDDLLIFTNPEIKNKAYGLIRDALAKGDGLCAKWMPRKGSTAVDLRNWLSWTPKFYRKRLVELTNVVETQMCAKDWNNINFSGVPSVAMSRYGKAFAKNSETYKTYLDLLGEDDDSVKVNAGAVYPYDVVKSLSAGNDVLADAQWEALPNFVGDSKILPMVDVSGSMYTRAGDGALSLSCAEVALSLGLYCSSKNTGDFKDVFLTFSNRPELVTVTGTLSQKLRQMEGSEWGMNTDLHAAFERILEVAVANTVPQEDMPKAVLILSDMQFDHCTKYDDSAIEMVRRKYEEAGYNVPGVVFWNLNSHSNVPVSYDSNGTALISGFSPSILKAVLSADFDSMTPESIMLKTLDDTRYAL